MRLLVLSAAVLSVFALGCGKEPAVSGPPANPNGPPGPGSNPPSATGDLSTSTPDVTMTAAAWSEEFAANTKAANAKYNGKVIELTGEVHEVAVVSSTSAPPKVLLKGAGDGTFEVHGRLSDPTVWERVWPGSTVTIRGQLSKTPNWPGELQPAIIHKGPAGPPPTVTAESLAEEMLSLKEPFPFPLKRQGEWCYVEGEVLKAEASEKSGESKITLKGKGDCNPFCVINYWERQRLSGLKPGDRVKVLGQYNGRWPGDPTLSPYLVLVVTFKKL